MAKRVGEEDAQLVQHLDSPENKRLVRLVALLEVRLHRCGRKVQRKCAGHDEDGGSVDILEGQVTNKLCLDDGTDVSKVGSNVVHGAVGCAGGDGRLDHA